MSCHGKDYLIMIVPALLTDNREELIRMVNLCAGFTDYVQIDIMDGEFVPSRSIGPQDLENWHPSTRCEAHLMVNDPLSWLEPLCRIGIKRIIYHFEIEKDHLEIISKLREMNMEVGIAVNPFTPLDSFEFLVGKADTFLFLSVDPGFYGSPFIPEVLEKLKSFKNKYPQKMAGIDGGIKLDNVLNAKTAGADYACVGSAILKSNNPEDAYKRFVELWN
jgi:ribulose-phosphate 3-epimerase